MDCPPPYQRRVKGYFPQGGQVQVDNCLQVRPFRPVADRPPLRAPLHVNGQYLHSPIAHRGPMRPIRFVKVTKIKRNIIPATTHLRVCVSAFSLFCPFSPLRLGEF